MKPNSQQGESLAIGTGLWWEMGWAGPQWNLCVVGTVLILAGVVLAG